MKQYKSLYSDLEFERAGLFKLIRETYSCREVLYPGCSIHIKPSFFFPHIVYVDQSQDAARFFAQEKPVLEFVNRHKNYKQSAYIRFIHQDYSTPLPFMDGSFDLLLAIFAGGISKACARYLKAGGVLITNNHQEDAFDAAQDESLQFTSTIRFHKGKYQIEHGNSEDRKFNTRRPNNKYLKQTSEGLAYMENETYYVFRHKHYRLSHY